MKREVIFTDDVERIFGKRQWVSRTDEILAARQDAEDVEAEDVTPPPFTGESGDAPADADADADKDKKTT